MKQLKNKIVRGRAAIRKEIIMEERLTFEEMKKKYPDRWVFVKNAEMDGPDVISGEVICVCDDEEYADKWIELINAGTAFNKVRTSHWMLGGGIINAENITITIE